MMTALMSSQVWWHVLEEEGKTGEFCVLTTHSYFVIISSASGLFAYVATDIVLV